MIHASVFSTGGEATEQSRRPGFFFEALIGFVFISRQCLLRDRRTITHIWLRREELIIQTPCPFRSSIASIPRPIAQSMPSRGECRASCFWRDRNRPPSPRLRRVSRRRCCVFLFP